VQLPSRTEPQWQVQVRDKPEPEPKVHLILSNYSTEACKSLSSLYDFLIYVSKTVTCDTARWQVSRSSGSRLTSEV
jgi:hypothetical protein